jgi:A/G-specific adenine glycosylase
MTEAPHASHAQSAPESLPEVERRHIVAFRSLVDSFEQHRRPLPWRVAEAGRRDPYRVWVSEVMLQQTRVDQAAPYFDRFVARYPTLEALAEAPVDDVLKSWEGLGYYARARNLHRAARIVVEEHGARIPDDPARFRHLPGVGAYTAAAVQSIAYGRPMAVVDGNVRRVLSRVFAVSDVRGAVGRTAIARLAEEVLDAHRPGPHNEAVMEHGATVCTPRRPRCPDCPLRPACAAFALDAVEEFPSPARGRPVPHVVVAVGIVSDEAGRVLVQRRPEDAMLGGLWEFPGGKVGHDETPVEACRRELVEEVGLEVDVAGLVARVDHAYSHFTVTLHAFNCVCRDGSRGSSAQSREGKPLRWATPAELAEFAMPRANRRIVDVLVDASVRPPR